MHTDCVECSDDEFILRAVTEVYWDEKNNKCSSSLMRGPNTSVSRISVLPFNTICEIFLKELHNPPDNPLLFTGEIKIENLKELGSSYEHKKTEIRVIEVPLEHNTAHAEIPGKLPKGLARKIANELTRRDLPF